jgi:hypothetical protein
MPEYYQAGFGQVAAEKKARMILPSGRIVLIAILFRGRPRKSKGT